ncbi:MAG TPA: hypothetical protein HA308_00790 [Candidatus Thalassarchaeaceae archaeon]|nr:hypothetical protein [Candidatus Thalassarchaeaceae archaeon]
MKHMSLGMQSVVRHVSFLIVMLSLVQILVIFSLPYENSIFFIFPLIFGIISIPIALLGSILLRLRKDPGIFVCTISLGCLGMCFITEGFLIIFTSTSIIVGALYVLLGITSFRRISTLNNPSFISWFGGKMKSEEVAIGEGEIVASCPHCSSILAVIPSLLSEADRCPECDGLLVI